MKSLFLGHEAFLKRKTKKKVAAILTAEHKTLDSISTNYSTQYDRLIHCRSDWLTNRLIG